MQTKNEIIREIQSIEPRKRWDKVVLTYAMELTENLSDDKIYYGNKDFNDLLNGAQDWTEYSWGGCSLVYNQDLAERLATASHILKDPYGEKRPNRNEEWLDVQARALRQAAQMIRKIMRLDPNWEDKQ